MDLASPARDRRGPDPDLAGVPRPGGQGPRRRPKVPLDWSESKNVAWKVPVAGSGWSSPVVGDGRVWLTTAVAGRETSLRALAFDMRRAKRSSTSKSFAAARLIPSTPRTPERRPRPCSTAIASTFISARKAPPRSRPRARFVWKTRHSYESQHGAGGSPVIYGDLLIFSCDGSDEAFVVALDKKTGKVKWKTGRRFPFAQAYTTPLAIRVGDRDQIVSIGAFRAAAYDPRHGQGDLAGRYGDGFSNVPRPVYGHGLVYIATGFQQPALIAVRPDGSGDVTKTHVAWTLRRGAPHTPSPLLVGNELLS